MKYLSVLILAICLIIGSQASAEKARYQTNTLYFDTVTAKPGEHFAVGVYMFNTDSLAGMQVPIFYRSDTIKLYCDSISFANSRCDYFMFKDVKIPDNDLVAYFCFINTVDPKNLKDPLPPGDGLVATIYFTAPEDCPAGTVKLTRGMIPHPFISFIFAVWNSIGDDLDANFEESEITIIK
jgi:hypothetical protein